MEDKNKKIAVIALIFGLIAISQAEAISTFSLNLIAGSGINITQSGDNYTITATGNTTTLSDNTKVNKTGDRLIGSEVTFINVHPMFNNISSSIIIDPYHAVLESDDMGMLPYHNGIAVDGNGVSMFSTNGISHLFIINQDGALLDGNLDMNNNNIINCGNCLTNETMAKDNTKVNKTGDNMTGLLYVPGLISSLTYNTTRIIPNDPKGTGSDYLGQFLTENNSASMSFGGYVPNSISNAAIFSSFRLNGTQEHTYPLGANSNIFWIGGRGTYSDTVNTGFPPITASKSLLLMKTSGAWSSTSQGTIIELATTDDGSTTRAVRLNISANGSIIMPKYAGTGNRMMCFDSNGMIYAGSSVSC
jgi:hypothetical protein